MATFDEYLQKLAQERMEREEERQGPSLTSNLLGGAALAGTAGAIAGGFRGLSEGKTMANLVEQHIDNPNVFREKVTAALPKARESDIQKVLNEYHGFADADKPHFKTVLNKKMTPLIGMGTGGLHWGAIGAGAGALGGLGVYALKQHQHNKEMQQRAMEEDFALLMKTAADVLPKMEEKPWYARAGMGAGAGALGGFGAGLAAGDVETGLIGAGIGALGGAALGGLGEYAVRKMNKANAMPTEKTAAYIVGRGPGGQIVAYDPSKDERLMELQEKKLSYLPFEGMVGGAALGGAAGAISSSELGHALRNTGIGAGVGALAGLGYGVYQRNKRQDLLDTLRG